MRQAVDGLFSSFPEHRARRHSRAMISVAGTRGGKIDVSTAPGTGARARAAILERPAIFDHVG